MRPITPPPSSYRQARLLSIHTISAGIIFQVTKHTHNIQNSQVKKQHHHHHHHHSVPAGLKYFLQSGIYITALFWLPTWRNAPRKKRNMKLLRLLAFWGDLYFIFYISPHRPLANYKLPGTYCRLSPIFIIY